MTRTISPEEWEEFSKEKGLTDEEFITEIFMAAMTTGVVLMDHNEKDQMSVETSGYKLTVEKIEAGL